MSRSKNISSGWRIQKTSGGVGFFLLRTVVPGGGMKSFIGPSKDIDFENQLIKVTAKKGTKDILEGEPKSRRNRVVPMPDETGQLLADIQAQAREGHPYIFVSPERLERIKERRKIGKWNPRFELVNNLTRDSNLIRSRANVTNCTIHDLRRSAITNWAQRLPIQVVQTLTGHSNIATTRKYYLAVRPGDFAAAGELLNSILAKTQDT